MEIKNQTYFLKETSDVGVLLSSEITNVNDPLLLSFHSNREQVGIDNDRVGTGLVGEETLQ